MLRKACNKPFCNLILPCCLVSKTPQVSGSPSIIPAMNIRMASELTVSGFLDGVAASLFSAAFVDEIFDFLGGG